MKKFLFAIVAALCLSATSFAQSKPAKSKTAVAKPAPAVKPAPTKKDGSADMRFKANKEAAKPAGPLKKDGTPDMRYKANKPAPKKKL